MGLLYITSEGSAPGALWEGARAFSTSPQRAQPQGLSGQSPHFEENIWQKFSPIQMYLKSQFAKSFFD